MGSPISHELDVISLASKFVAFNTVNPPGNEEEIARFAGNILADHGFCVDYIPYGENRLHLVAEKGVVQGKAPIILSGHLDTVPPGNQAWSIDPFSGEVSDGKIWGLGSSDMKGALAAMVVASIEVFAENPPTGGVRLIITADEEPGCKGVQHVIRSLKNTQGASAIIVGEPTANLPAIGHKGAIYLNAICSGKTAHSSMPEKGINAIYKAARAIIALSEIKLNAEWDPLLGDPTLNVGKMRGGMNINSVPDHAEFTIDIRTNSKTDHQAILHAISETMGREIALETLVDITPVYTPPEDPFVKCVYAICGIGEHHPGFPLALPYMTDGSVLQRFYHQAPTVILGPGQPEMAHQTDEYCFIHELNRSVILYKNIISKWAR